MKLLLINKNLSNLNNVFIGVNTDNGEIRNFELDLNDLFFINKDARTTCVSYSGDYLILAVENKDETILLFINIFDKTFFYYLCTNTKDIRSIISIYPGKLYVTSIKTNSINAINFNISPTTIVNDSVHFSLNKFDYLKNIYGLCSWNNRWYSTFRGNYLNEKMDGCIYEFSNDRIVYSALEKPTNLFFNENHRFCFLEKGKKLFHCGDNIFYVEKIPKMILEDRIEGGYWILCENNINSSSLSFLKYNGKLHNSIMDFYFNFSTMIESRGIFFKCI